MNDMSVGEFIVEAYIKPLGISRAQFALAADMSESTLSRIINGKCEITIDVAKKLHKATGRSVKSWLILEVHRKIAEDGNESKESAKIALANLLDLLKKINKEITMKLSKSKLALAKVINENGGWVDGANFSSQDYDGWVFHFRTKPTKDCGSEVWNHGGCIGKGHFKVGKINNWHQTCLSREEYYWAYPKADADGWFEWNGGECPVGDFDEVQVKYKVDDGSGMEGCEAQELHWHHEDADFDIVAYRLHKPEVKPEFCESVTRSIPEPEEKPTIEHLAQYYRNRLDFAKRKQQEADDAKVAADAALVELERAGEALGLFIGIAKPDLEPELVITDWRDLLANDVIFVDEYDGHESGEYVVVSLEDDDYDGDYAVMATGIDGCDRWIDTTVEWRFIRRP